LITNVLFKEGSEFSKKTSTFFRKDTLENFFLMSDLSTQNYLNSVIKKKPTYSFWRKAEKKDTNQQPAFSYMYKPDNLLSTGKNLECFFLRKSKNFNKGRYSRNRQIYRTGVYMCFYVNVIALYMLWFYFYKFKFKFTYIWWLFILLPFSFINARALKYNLYFPKEFLYQLNNYLNWMLFLKKK